MKIQSKVYKVGKSSLMILIPSNVAKQYGLKENTPVEMDIIKDKLIIEKTGRKK
ncbi:MAG: AbrB/MazE/SpoVT family DNA-binding domain-containing protein [Thermoplasmatales archaeon]|nr:AbrB/MazE/SpoVT family DNA-binding domain-containing protein [Candidatus Thermoplasmatota archaeon]MBU4256725.1 AbrB/MazE/SpoVT family DNA-binding domain-containing protein [Candidatus Thermoplasmatota archaeon]MCG2824995.1 AbrB/MazE/SpoVT family DNA-binding domain-containing protein [Thermoplasmatales archaeon]